MTQDAYLELPKMKGGSGKSIWYVARSATKFLLESSLADDQKDWVFILLYCCFAHSTVCLLIFNESIFQEQSME